MTREERYKHYYNEGYNAGSAKGYEQAIKNACEWLRYHIQVDEPKIEYNEDGQPLAESFIAHAKARCMAADEVIEQFKKDFGLC